jgi:putative flippase GtrA
MRQLARYAVVGVASNLAGYLAYLLLTWLNVGPKLAMSLVYITGASVGYFGNRQWTFAHKGKVTSTLLKYGLAHCSGYALNFLLLYIFVDKMFFPHQAVQAVAIFIVAGLLFVMFKKSVFSPISDAPGTVIKRLDKDDHI